MSSLRTADGVTTGRRWLLMAVVLVAAASVTVGCGKKDPFARQPLEGVITWEGKPIALGAVALEPALAAVDRIAATMPQQLSSTAQDVARRKPSEIEQLNGFIVRRGLALGVPTPVNQTLHALVKLVETGDRPPAVA